MPVKNSTRPRFLSFLLSGRLETLTGGYEYDRRIIAGLRERGWSVSVQELDDSFPRPTAAAREQAGRTLANIPDGGTVIVDGLALGAMPAEAEREAQRLRLLALVHHPLADETGIDRQMAAELAASERRALAAVRHVVVTSHATASSLTAYGVEGGRVSVVEPGTDPSPIARGSQGAAVQLLCVATIIPRKGHDILLRALAAVSNRRWHLTCVGSLDRDPATADRVRAQVRALGLDDRVELSGEVEGARLAALYDRADLFVLPALHEGYGMAVAEALARGLPVIGTDTGAVPQLIAETAGIVIPPDDVDALVVALARVLDDPDLRVRLAQGARNARTRLPTWRDAAARMSDTLERVGAEFAPPPPTRTTLAPSLPTRTFTADWLALREPADVAARSARLVDSIAQRLAAQDPIRALDLAAGTGANARYLASRLPFRLDWLLVDRDPGLLAEVASRMPPLVNRSHVETRQTDLLLIKDGGGAELFAGRALVTASALLDLVSEAWLKALAARCRESAAAVLFGLTYDGRIECSPAEPEDALIREHVNRHQRTDKGFGPALGPDATDVADATFRALGYEVRRDRSDWVLPPAMGTLQCDLIKGWAAAAVEIAPADTLLIRRWSERRLAYVENQQSEILVGHEDIAAWLTESGNRVIE